LGLLNQGEGGLESQPSRVQGGGLFFEVGSEAADGGPDLTAELVAGPCKGDEPFAGPFLLKVAVALEDVVGVLNAFGELAVARLESLSHPNRLDTFRIM
jgi:hypothetical protein